MSTESDPHVAAADPRVSMVARAAPAPRVDDLVVRRVPRMTLARDRPH